MCLSIPNHPITARRCGGPRRGFTLVELLVVISIIALLAALLIPAVYVAIRKAKEARVALEIAAISKALDSYKLTMGEYPPDFTYDPSNTAVTPQDQIAAQINGHLSRTYRRRNVAGDLPLQVNLATGASTPIANASDYARLDPAEAVYFWLQGFSPDPQAPLSGAGDRSPFFEFDRTRLTDSDADGFLEYHPKGDTNKVPYAYYAARSTGSDATAYFQVAAYLQATNPRGLPLPYFVATKVPNPSGNTADPPVNSAAAAKKFQLISAGLDSMFGNGGLVTGAAAVPTAEKDNMASFTEGAKLVDLVD